MSGYFYFFWAISSLPLAVRLLLEKREPSATMAWLLFILLCPFIGPVIYTLAGPERLERQAIKRKKDLESLLTPAPTKTASAKSLGTEEDNIVRLAKQISDYAPTSGNHVAFLEDPETTLAKLEAAIHGAQSFIHLEYYIISSDEVTERLFSGLAQAAQRGVEVRLLYDAFGSLSLKAFMLRKLSKAGVRIAGFLPLSVVPSRMHLNFRNHRKILLIDGKIAFTGGTNIGKDYLGRQTKTQWHDYTVQVTGPACRQLQDVFAKDWHFTTQEDLFDPRYYPASDEMGDATIQVMESGPDSQFASLHQALFLAMNSAEKEILLTTPYFVPDPAILTTLQVCALRGVKVQLILPAKTDAPIVRWASRSFLDQLLDAGVEIYQYLPRVLHAKLLIIDDKWTILGSANMDIRSFRLNFELNLLIYGAATAKQAKECFTDDLKESERIVAEEFRQRPVSQRLIENTCRLFSPLL